VNTIAANFLSSVDIIIFPEPSKIITKCKKTYFQ
jgi:hypothetical protein